MFLKCVPLVIDQSTHFAHAYRFPVSGIRFLDVLIDVVIY